MATYFTNPPLIELIAELRWTISGPQQEGVHPSLTPPIVVDNSGQAEFFTRFSGKIHGDGYQNVERLIPQGMPFFAHQPAYRFRKHESAANTALYQVGPGVFTANATPPYKSWDDFSPVVKAGVEALLTSRNNDDAFFSVSLRYIDAFDLSLTEGKDVSEFIQNTLGISITLPAALSCNIAPGKNLKPYLQLQLPMKNDMVMNVSIGEGVANGNSAIILDTSVATVTQTPPNTESIMVVLNEARTAIHNMFFGITEPIKHLMQPTEDK